ncbi:condensation protein [Dactylosporangium vinaceum]|uniref:Condensation domain-containing protein n=1 Tax=Dactylosporangium vinaceum TaxID=53362 RepID=A0ABV5MRW3_9ACTN|nr:condensation domain-containing protein [Dactylosporangium vinaceum]UAC00372.1 condensation protein [Dactylosporangium vinaceum]
MEIVVEFEGAGSGIAELTWGQRDVWDLMRQTGRTMNIGGTMPCAPGETIEHLAGLLRFIVSRHQALRTRITVDGGRPRQHVHASGRIGLEIVDGGPDPEGTAERLRVRYQTTHFDPAREWPVRMGVVVDGDRPTHTVLMYYHVVIDGFGIDAIVRDLANLGDPAAPVQGVTPLELAAQQGEPGAVRQSEKARRAWEKQIARIAAAGIAAPEPADPGLGQPRHWEVVCESPALALALRAVGARTGLASGPILLAAYAVALSRATGADTAAVQVIVSNRFRPGFADAATSLRQFGLVVLETGAGFDEVAARAWSGTLSAYKHGYFDNAGLPGVPEPTAFFNDRRRGTGESGDVVAAVGDIEAAREKTSVRWGVREDTYDGTFYLHLEDEPGRIVYTLWGDTHRYAPAVIEQCARDLEAVVIAAADAGEHVPSLKKI